MAMYAIRRISEAFQPRVEFVSKRGLWDPDFKKARLFSSMGAAKNSILYWPGNGDRDAEIIELELQPTGKAITVEEAMKPLEETRRELERRRRETIYLTTRQVELEELRRLKEKYPEEK